MSDDDIYKAPKSRIRLKDSGDFWVTLSWSLFNLLTIIAQIVIAIGVSFVLFEDFAEQLPVVIYMLFIVFLVPAGFSWLFIRNNAFVSKVQKLQVFLIASFIVMFFQILFLVYAYGL
ncbi:hypothetical protein FLL45_12115 [Aliikangiella marina]|uniref:Uncharacterized protein n=1 Tax=Aliikangiella marina TaxID=1712262 RepID=A0A545T8R8_9GAMM|nr:hypothetical protein [Aliikangiella marina]TQV73612.1 hypothetical protein FLL45_12115 [Aliikangiella marina]